MITLEAPGATLTIAATPQRLESQLSRELVVTRSGQLVVVGDAGWDPATLTLTFRASSTSNPDAATERNAALAIIAQATAIHAGNQVTYLHGLTGATVRLRGVWWEITAVFAPRALNAANHGTGEHLTIAGQPVTLGGIPITLEV